MISFAPIPLDAILDQRLGKNDLRVLAFLHYKNGPKGCFPARTTVCDALGMWPQKVSESVTNLVIFGWLERSGRYFVLHQECQRKDVKKPSKKVTKKVICHQNSDNQNVTNSVPDVTNSVSECHQKGDSIVTKSVTHIRTDKNSDKNSDKNKESVTALIAHLNHRTNSRFQVCETNAKFIRARLNSGMTVEDLKIVVDYKTSEWLGNEKMQEFLRPETLFGPKCEGYLQAANRPKPRFSPTTMKNINSLGEWINAAV